ncbi:MAG TPA: hypothetical protein VHW25_11675 [Steroidobacteraceae bacterium]|nr:hypothetical protein [Steroidobacteraceae bacterium]
MKTEPSKAKQPPGRPPGSEGSESGSGTEAQKKGGIEPAKRQAERDWQDSAKESGD